MQRRRRNIVFVIMGMAGGAGVFCRTLALGLCRYSGDEYTTTLLSIRAASRHGGDRSCFDRVESLGVDLSDGPGKFFTLPVLGLRLRAALGRLQPDATITVGTYANLVVPAVAPRGPILLTEHVHLSRRMETAFGAPFLRRLIRTRYPGRIIAVPSEGVADDLRSAFGARDVRVIPHGIDEAAVRALAREPLSDLAPQPFFIACGRMTDQKDYPTLLHAYALAVQQGVDEALVIVGDGPDRHALEALARELELAGRVHFLGHRDNPYPFMAQSRALVLSSVWEGFGLVLLEAMTLGVPVISTDCPSGPAEILDGGRAGTLVPVGDAKALADRMLELSRDPDLQQRMAAQSAQRAAAYSLQAMTIGYDGVIREITGTASPDRSPR